MSEMIERVATALFNYDGDGRKFSDLRTSQREYWLDTARAAIEAMREPTDTMENAVDNIQWYEGMEEGTGNPPSSLVWSAMIDAALSPAKTER